LVSWTWFGVVGANEVLGSELGWFRCDEEAGNNDRDATVGAQNNLKCYLDTWDQKSI